jgi:hypothetical protein
MNKECQTQTRHQCTIGHTHPSDILHKVPVAGSVHLELQEWTQKTAGAPADFAKHP